MEIKSNHVLEALLFNYSHAAISFPGSIFFMSCFKPILSENEPRVFGVFFGLFWYDNE